MGGLKRDLMDEEDSAYGRADRVRVAASGEGNTQERDTAKYGNLHANLVREEEAIWPDVHGTAHQNTPDS